ncbi:MAG: hypothetical protein ACJAT2_002570, partial [Bacteriovoracaceae bacterium]
LCLLYESHSHPGPHKAAEGEIEIGEPPSGVSIESLSLSL